MFWNLAEPLSQLRNRWWHPYLIVLLCTSPATFKTVLRRLTISEPETFIYILSNKITQCQFLVSNAVMKLKPGFLRMTKNLMSTLVLCIGQALISPFILVVWRYRVSSNSHTLARALLSLATAFPLSKIVNPEIRMSGLILLESVSNIILCWNKGHFFSVEIIALS